MTAYAILFKPYGSPVVGYDFWIPGVREHAERARTIPLAIRRGRTILELEIAMSTNARTSPPRCPSPVNLMGMANADDEVFMTFVEMEAPRAPPVRTSITIHQDLINAIDKAAEQAGVSRSQFLCQAAADKIAGVKV